MDPSLDPALHRLLDVARSAEAARSRSGFGSLRDHHSEDATLVGLLANLLECRAHVTIQTRSGAERRGVIELVGECGILVSSSLGTRVLLRVPSIMSIRSHGIDRLDGDGRATLSMSWPSMVARFAEPGFEVSVTSGTAVTCGSVRYVSRTMLTLATPGGVNSYVVVDAIDEVSLSVPGAIRQD